MKLTTLIYALCAAAILAYADARVAIHTVVSPTASIFQQLNLEMKEAANGR